MRGDELREGAIGYICGLCTPLGRAMRNGLEMMTERNYCASGYLRCIPYSGDRWELCETIEDEDGIDIAYLLDEFRGKKIRVSVEVLEE